MRSADDVTPRLSDPRKRPGDHRSGGEWDDDELAEWDDDELARYVELC